MRKRHASQYANFGSLHTFLSKRLINRGKIYPVRRYTYRDGIFLILYDASVYQMDGTVGLSGQLLIVRYDDKSLP